MRHRITARDAHPPATRLGKSPLSSSVNSQKIMITQPEYNEWFRMMLSKHPLKHEYKLEARNHEGTEYLSASIAHPDNEEKNIIISTYGKELPLFIWHHHEHHDSFEEDNHEEEFQYLCDYIDDIMADKVFFAVGYKEGKIAYETASYKIDDLTDEKVDKIDIMSWSGEHDKIIEYKG